MCAYTAWEPAVFHECTNMLLQAAIVDSAMPVLLRAWFSPTSVSSLPRQLWDM